MQINSEASKDLNVSFDLHKYEYIIRASSSKNKLHVINAISNRHFIKLTEKLREEKTYSRHFYILYSCKEWSSTLLLSLMATYVTLPFFFFFFKCYRSQESVIVFWIIPLISLAPIGAWKCNFALLGNYDNQRRNNQRTIVLTNRPTDGHEGPWWSYASNNTFIAYQ